MTSSPQEANFRMPPAVAALAAKANALIESQKPADEAPKAPDAPPADTPPVTATADTSFEAPKPEVTQADAPPADAPKVTDAGNDQTWEQRFRSEQGRTKALREQVSGLQADIAALNAQLEALRAAPKELTFGTGPRLITPEEEAEYGADFMDVVAKRAQEVAAPLVQQINDLKAQLEGVQAKTHVNTRQTMLKQLSDLVPNWKELNKHQPFLDWLNETDEFTGQSRQTLLDSALERNDAARVAAFFQRFNELHATTAPQAQAQPDTKLPLEQLAAPGRAKSATTPSTVQPDKPFIKASDISKFYTDVARNRYKGREDEKQRIEKLIAEATRDGRVIQ